MSSSVDVETALAAWFSEQLDSDVRVEGLSRVEFGHSAEMLLLTLHWQAPDPRTQGVVVRLRPPYPGLLEPYDLRAQFDVLKTVEDSPVRAPRALWIEESGTVLGRPFFVMERLEGTSYEMDVPGELAADAEQLRAMATRVVEQIAAIHLVDVTRTVGAAGSLADEIDHWESEILRVQRGPLPALERLIAELRMQRPTTASGTTLVHGDLKPGNFAFVGDEVTAVFDWEMAAVGDPMTDIGYADLTWPLTPLFGSLSPEDVTALWEHYEEITGIVIHDRAWHKALQALKVSAITLVGSMLFDKAFSDDWRFAEMGLGIPMVTQMGLDALGVAEPLESGPVRPRRERIAAVREKDAQKALAARP